MPRKAQTSLLCGPHNDGITEAVIVRRLMIDGVMYETPLCIDHDNTLQAVLGPIIRYGNGRPYLTGAQESPMPAGESKQQLSPQVPPLRNARSCQQIGLEGERMTHPATAPQAVFRDPAMEGTLPYPEQPLVPALNYKTVFVTSRIATHWRTHVLRPRPLSPATVDQYTRDMCEPGRWRGLNSESLAFSSIQAGIEDTPECQEIGQGCGGRELLEGNQRLLALINAAEICGLQGLWMSVAFDVDPEDMPTINTGRSRSASDHRVITSSEFPPEVYPIARRIVSWEVRNGTALGTGNFKASQQEVDQRIAKYQDAILAAVDCAKRTYTTLHLPVSVTGFGHWLLHQIDPEDAEIFFEQISGTGAGLEEGDPALMFRNRVNGDRLAGKRLSEPTILSLLFLAWNELRARKKDTRTRLALEAEGKPAPKPRKHATKLQLPDGGATSIRFPRPKMLSFPRLHRVLGGSTSTGAVFALPSSRQFPPQPDDRRGRRPPRGRKGRGEARVVVPGDARPLPLHAGKQVPAPPGCQNYPVSGEAQAPHTPVRNSCFHLVTVARRTVRGMH